MIIIDDGNVGDTVIYEKKNLLINNIPESTYLIILYLRIGVVKYSI